MASTIFHHWLDRFHAWPATRQRRVRIGLWCLGVVAAFALGFATAQVWGSPGVQHTRAHQLAERNAALQSRVQGLQQQQQTASTALAALRSSLASRDAEVQKLKQEQAFYARLIGIDGDRSGLGVHSLDVTPVAETHAWNFVATLVNTAERADPARGRLTLEVEGVRNGKLTTLDWSSLAGPDDSKGLPFAFKFFQQLHGSFILPQGFVPNRVTVTLHPQRGSTVNRRINWDEAAADRPGSVPDTP